MNNQRFVNLNLLTIQYPLTAIISILHRLSGIFVFLLIPYLLWLADVALSGVDGFHHIQSILMSPVSKCVIWFFLVALGYHLLAGIRHLLMDIGLGESLHHARLSGVLVLTITIIWIIRIGMWLW